MTYKIIQMIVLVSLLLGLQNCKNAKEDVKLPESQSLRTNMAIQVDGEKHIAVMESALIWKGHKLIGTHTGKVQLKQGVLNFESGVLKTGKIIVDMHSIQATELMKDGEDEDEEGHDDRDDLAGHLKNADFFDVSTYPEAVFIIKEAVSQSTNEYLVKGDMTIKGVTKPIAFLAEVGNHILKAELTLNRTEFGIKYGSGSFFDNLGDNVIKDEFDLQIELIF